MKIAKLTFAWAGIVLGLCAVFSTSLLSADGGILAGSSEDRVVVTPPLYGKSVSPDSSKPKNGPRLKLAACMEEGSSCSKDNDCCSGFCSTHGAHHYRCYR